MKQGVVQSEDAILFEVKELVDAPSEVLGITLHTAFLGAKDDNGDAELLLKKMAEKGQGSFFNFTTAEEIDFSLFDFEVKRLPQITVII